jgi:hypothetical protein
MDCLDWLIPRGVVCAILLVCGGRCSAQQSSTVPGAPALATASSADTAQDPPAPAPSTPLPDSPDAQAGARPSSGTQIDEEQTKRIMGMLPNFRSVTAGEVVPPETTQQKLATATLDNFDYTALLFAGLIAADSFVTKATPEFHQGAAGYARYYWHTVADQSVENYMVELIVPAVTHEDSRYFAMGREGGGYWKRVGYSLSRVVVARKDSGKATFNTSEVAGSGIAAGVSLFYYPTSEQTVHTGLRDWGLDIAYDSLTFAFHEFWPDISHAVFGNRGKATAAAH